MTTNDGGTATNSYHGDRFHTVEANPLMPGSYLVNVGRSLLRDGSWQEDWVPVLPTHRRQYRPRCQAFLCPHTAVVERYVEEVRGR